MTTDTPKSPICAVFARAPILGRVKTRLAQSVGAAAALEVHRSLLERTLRVVASVPEVDAELWLDANPESPLQIDLPLRLQGAGDLGQRMLGVIDDITRRRRAAIVLGSDCPMLNAAYLRGAVQGLVSGADVVLGPVEDGGYILIGMHRPIPELLLGMTWSTATVLGETLARAASMNLRVELLSRLWDVDTAADLQRWRGQSRD